MNDLWLRVLGGDGKRHGACPLPGNDFKKNVRSRSQWLANVNKIKTILGFLDPFEFSPLTQLANEKRRERLTVDSTNACPATQKGKKVQPCPRRAHKTSTSPTSAPLRVRIRSRRC